MWRMFIFLSVLFTVLLAKDFVFHESESVASPLPNRVLDPPVSTNIS
jgi:hypothetical protein